MPAPRFVLGAFVCFLSLPAAAAEFVVDTVLDGVDASPGDGLCDDGAGRCPLRAAVQESNALAGDDEVFLDAAPPGPGQPTVYRLTRKRDPSVEDALTGDLDVVGDELTIHGDGADSTVIDGKGGRDRIFDVYTPASGGLFLSGLTLRNGRAPRGGDEESGGCIRTFRRTQLDFAIVERCSAPGDGGCIATLGGSTGVFDSWLHACSARGAGGGVAAISQGSFGNFVLLDSTISGSRAGRAGGAVAARGNDRLVQIRNSTLSGNAAPKGGGVAAEEDSEIVFSHATVAGNKARSAASLSVETASVAVIENSIFWSKRNLNCGTDVGTGARWRGAGGSLDGGSSCEFERENVDPLLGPLADNGGPVPTHALPPGSPAIDNAEGNSCLTTDARGEPRVDVPGVGVALCDLGAYEFQP
jgi:hypothetical protein